MSPPSVPPQAPPPGRPLPSSGSLQDGFPGSIGTPRRLRPPLPASAGTSFARAIPASPPASLRLLRSAVPPLAPPFAPPATDALPEDPDHFVRRPRRFSRDGEDETSQVWATLAHMPRSQTPAVRQPQAPSGPALASSAQLTASTPQEFTFGAPSRGLRAPCVRFAAGVTPAPRNTRFRLGARLGRSGLSPAGSHRRFPPCLSFYMPSPFTRLRLAQQLHNMSAHTHSLRKNTGFSGRNRVWLKFTASEDKPHAPTVVLARHSRGSGNPGTFD